MDNEKYGALVSRLERSATERPARYRLLVVLVALFGFGILGVALGIVFMTILALIALVWLVVAKGGAALLILAKLGKAAILLALPAWAMIKSSLTLFFSRFPPPQGRELTRPEAPRLFEQIHELRRRMNGPEIHKVLLTDDINAAIVQHPRLGLFGWEVNYLILGLPLLQALGEREALAVVAHEYGHLSGYHGRMGGFIYRLRSSWGRLQELSGQWTDWGSRLIARLFRWYAPYFNAYTFVLARQNEYEADRSSAEIAGRQDAANALMRTNIAAQFAETKFWPSVNRRAGLEPEPLGSRSSFWQESLKTGLDPQQRSEYLEIARRRETDHFDTHPALKDRLAAIGATLDEAAAQRLEPVAVTAATAWLEPHLDELVAEFDATWRESIATQWRERHTYLRQREARLAELESLETPTPDELWERIGALDELHPERDLMAPIGALLEIAPMHLAARFRRGTLMLERGDETGIADLEHVMAEDRDAILPGCEAAWRFYQSRNADKARDYAQRGQQRANHLAAVRTECRLLLAPTPRSPLPLCRRKY